ncbi:lens fiber membrane intrinsic protein-like [Hydractinia symbiolongicarpus]|uniref:lens fiber membrane intrinsic protein-like n=1 Tax=Hydractinia symbiolongicarpus TaxID=13093 RepID=UPI00254E5818|nr:lens fiber membrane intrinsic protein-like [Hydractinia symbiolongicarpus]XP_057311678.1 lens fiber membrane intrinsic protein-like [Hydractinia symbiolongicarpus]XP_057311679.1 lens fiber membrane intrinsic protein-like [Hydractinia symbiolongicarpus]XP_057311729.1 lens fiber membrane intrinsic protein-like [Hydractinia symbiolongicarpus]XP_057311730.1 lens fiber membrane intrinsic protein-like [Hydractinia symbiolongicarpus]
MGVGKILLIVGSIGAFIFLAACTGGNYWVVSKFSSDVGQGLWKACEHVKCVSIDDNVGGGKNLEDWFKAVRAFAIISCLASVGGILISILGVVSDKVKGLFASIFLFAAAGCMALALVIFSSKINLGSTIKFGWSYILGWIGTLGGIGTAVVGILAEKF